MHLKNAGLQPLKLYFYAKFIFHEKNKCAEQKVYELFGNLSQ